MIQVQHFVGDIVVAAYTIQEEDLQAAMAWIEEERGWFRETTGEDVYDCEEDQSRHKFVLRFVRSESGI